MTHAPREPVDVRRPGAPVNVRPWRKPSKVRRWRKPSKVRRWRNGIFVVFFATGFSVASWMSRLPRLRDLLDATTTEMGLLVFSASAGAVLALLASSHLIALLGARRAIRGGLVLIGAGMVTAGLGASAASVAVIVAGLVVAGIGMGLTDVAMNLSGADCERQLGRTAMPFFHASFSFGTMAGAGVGAAAAALGVPIAAQTLLTAAVVVGALLATRLVPADVPRSAQPGDAATWRERLAVWRHPAPWAIGLVVLGMSLAEGAGNDWLALAAVDGRGLTDAAGALLLGTFLTAITIGRLGGGVLVDRIGRVRAVAATALIAVAGLILVIFVDDPVALYAGAALWGFGASLGFPLGMSAAADHPRDSAARISAVATIGYLAFLVFPPLLGVLGDAFGILNSLLVCLALTLVAALAAPALRERALNDAP